MLFFHLFREEGQSRIGQSKKARIRIQIQIQKESSRTQTPCVARQLLFSNLVLSLVLVIVFLVVLPVVLPLLSRQTYKSQPYILPHLAVTPALCFWLFGYLTFQLSSYRA
ncbi:hypothetical protein P40081_10490 [Paenibacillus sp. FSL P4-0081]|nr:hypothetical protein P40081_10490 [Paenibacillus sp. FSL P4-0081]